MAVETFLRHECSARRPHLLRAAERRAQSVMHALAEKQISQPATAWHCCLEFYSVATRLPPEFRLTPADAVTLVQEEVFGRMSVHGLPTVRSPGAPQDGGTGRHRWRPHL